MAFALFGGVPTKIQGGGGLKERNVSFSHFNGCSFIHKRTRNNGNI